MITYMSQHLNRPPNLQYQNNKTVYKSITSCQ